MTDGAPESQRPTPVRLSMDARRESAQPPEFPSARIRRGEEEWIVRAEGWAETGGAKDKGAPLLYLTFSRANDPEERVRETVRVGRSLDALGESELLAALGEARPWEGDWERSDLFAGTRRGRRG